MNILKDTHEGIRTTKPPPFVFIAEEELAVKAGYWHCFRYNPAAKAEGKDAFTLDSKAPTADYKEFIMGEARYSALTRSFPERAEKLFGEAEKVAADRYEHLLKLSKLYE